MTDWTLAYVWAAGLLPCTFVAIAAWAFGVRMTQKSGIAYVVLWPLFLFAGTIVTIAVLMKVIQDWDDKRLPRKEEG